MQLDGTIADLDSVRRGAPDRDLREPSAVHSAENQDISGPAHRGVTPANEAHRLAGRFHSFHPIDLAGVATDRCAGNTRGVHRAPRGEAVTRKSGGPVLRQSAQIHTRRVIRP